MGIYMPVFKTTAEKKKTHMAIPLLMEEIYIFNQITEHNKHKKGPMIIYQS